ncbi:MAG: hypothetical protein CMJ48_09420 [Planctomycetaceae bacterium]|nr:hypothetical protein [Planctomycetaceae bacterium]
MLFLAIASATIGLSGCASLSLFGETHTHHHTCDDPEGKQRIETLEARISHLERMLSAQPTTPGVNTSSSTWGDR